MGDPRQAGGQAHAHEHPDILPSVGLGVTALGNTLVALDDLKTSGLFTVAATNPNSPIVASGNVLVAVSNTGVTQLFMRSSNNAESRVWMRAFGRTNGWQPWVELSKNGTTANDDAPAGQIGEYVKSNVLVGSAVALTNGVQTNVTSLSLGAGDWDVWAQAVFSVTVTTDWTQFRACTSRTSATLAGPGDDTQGEFRIRKVAGTSQAFDNAYSVPTARMSLAVPTTVYLVAFAAFSVSTVGASGYIAARRVR